MRWVFWALALAVLVATCAPIPEPSGPQGSDKYEHFAAFYALALAAAVAYPRSPLWLTALLVSAYGGLIELIQALPFVHRDCNLYDFLADAAGAVAATAPLYVSGLRARGRADKPSP
ncbi:MAG TPA: hypothetical protein VFN88_08035 [Caulobacteraceae bacterium]|nr:hypothetical protein [Caulobacteraceae bacterium]